MNLFAYHRVITASVSTHLAPSAGQLRHIGVGRTHAGTHLTLLIQERDVTVINAATGEILQELIIDLNRDYQPAGIKK